jgi:hypothetical protein
LYIWQLGLGGLSGHDALTSSATRYRVYLCCTSYLNPPALKAIITWGFREAQFNRIEAQVHPDNTASLALLEALGFLQEGRQREAGYWAGRHHDLLQYALLNAQWSTATSV